MDTTSFNTETRISLVSPRMRTFALVFIAVGIFISGYLSYVKFTDEPMACVASSLFDCGTVQNSVYSEFLGIPIAYFGLATYLILGAAYLLEGRIGLLQTDGRLIIFGITLFAWVYSMYLVYLQAFVLDALCSWCLAHEINITGLFIIAIVRLLKDMRGGEDLA